MGCMGTPAKPGKLQTPKQGALEKEVLGSSWAMFEPLLKEMGYQITSTPGIGKKSTPTYSITKAALTPEKQAEEDFLNNWRTKTQETLMGGTVPDDVNAQLSTLFDTRQSEVQRQINEAMIQSAGRRGLQTSDSPIAEVYARNTREAAQNLRGQQAQAWLGLRSEELNRAGGFVEYLNNLRQMRGFQNPFNVAKMGQDFGLGMYGPRMGATKMGTGTPGTSGWLMPALGAVGTAAGGLFGGPAGAAIGSKIVGMFSSGAQSPQSFMSDIDSNLIGRGYDTRGLG